jgi:hypothetical protein
VIFLRKQLWAAALALVPMAGLADPAMRDVIDRQFGAFRDGDPARAFEFASPMIQGLFGSPERFGEMVAQGYPMVWSPGELRFGGVRTEQGHEVQTVIVTAQDGSVHVLEYRMIQSEGGWKINGVRIIPPAGIGA